MHYTYAEFTNFKGIRKLRIDFDKVPRNTVSTLVGLNESGKTTILEAMSFFEYGKEALDPNEITGYRMPDIHELIPVSKRSNFSDNISITFGVRLDAKDNLELSKTLCSKYDIVAVQPTECIEITETHKFENSQFVDNGTSRLWSFDVNAKRKGQRIYRKLDPGTEEWLTAVRHIANKLPPILYFPNFLFEFPDRIYLEPTGGQTLTSQEKFYCTVVQDILDALDNGTNVEEHVVKRAKSSTRADQSSLSALLLEMERNVTSNVFRQWNEIFHRAESEKRIKIQLGGKDDRVYVSFLVEDEDGVFEIGEKSLGFRWFFVFSLLTYYRGFRKEIGGNVLFLLDEPASNLHSTAQQQLLTSFERLGRRCNLVYTTHSHHLINPVWLENTFVVRNAGLDYAKEQSTFDFNARKTDITIERYREFAVKHPDQYTYFQPVLDALEYRPSAFENIPDVVMLEGKNDFYTLSYTQWLISGIDSLNLLPGGSGAGSLDTAIRRYISWGREFIVLLDSDCEGENQKQRYNDLFGQ